MKSFSKTVLVFILLLSLGLVIAWIKRNELIEPILEKQINRSQSKFFENTLDISGFDLRNDFRVSIASVRGTYQTEKGGFPFEVNNVATLDPVTNFVLKKPVRISFEQFKPGASAYPGVGGNITLLNDGVELFELDAHFLGLYLEELTALNPDVLKGSSGKLTGNLYLKAQKTGERELRLSLRVIPPGGKLQAHFFDVLLPYLPAADKKALEAIRQAKTVGYKEAKVSAELTGKNALKILLNIGVPEYNLDLNLDLTIRVEESESFLELAKLMGLIKVEST